MASDPDLAALAKSGRESPASGRDRESPAPGRGRDSPAPTRGVHKNQNVRVFCRVRPINKKERAELNTVVQELSLPPGAVGADGGVITFDSDNVVSVPKPKGIQLMDTSSGAVERSQSGSSLVSSPSNDGDSSKAKGSFTFDHVFCTDSTQEAVFRACGQPLCAEVMQGYNCTTLAYGQTGSGKTHTMMGYSAEGIAEACGEAASDDEEEPEEDGEASDATLKPLTAAEKASLKADVAKLNSTQMSQLKSLVQSTSKASGGSFGGEVDVANLDVVKLDTKLQHLVRRYVRFSSGPSAASAAKPASRWQKEEEQGLVPRMVRAIFDAINRARRAAAAAAAAVAAAAASGRGEEKSTGSTSSQQGHDHDDGPIEYTVRVSYVEIYLERVRDLLNPVMGSNLKIRENKDRGIYIEGVTEEDASSFADVLSIMERGDLQRSVAATRMNAKSSRSHSVFMMSVAQRDRQTNARKNAKLVMVDLAGSEKVRKTGAAGLTLLQAQHTNKSLAALGNVINSLTEGRAHVPYRDSKLTRLLSDSLGGNSKTALIITCSPALQNLEETYGTLRFGVRAKRIKNKAHVNQELTAAQYKAMLAAAKKKIDKQALIIKALEKDLSGALTLLAKHNIEFNLASTAAREDTDTDTATNSEEVEELQDESTYTKLRSNAEKMLEASVAAELEESISALRAQLKAAGEGEEALRDQLLQSTSNVHEQKVKMNDLHNKIKTLKAQVRKEQMVSLELKEEVARQHMTHHDNVVSSLSDLEQEREKMSGLQKQTQSELSDALRTVDTLRQQVTQLEAALAQAQAQAQVQAHAQAQAQAGVTLTVTEPERSASHTSDLLSPAPAGLSTPTSQRKKRTSAHDRHASLSATSDTSFQEFLTSLDDAERAGLQGNGHATNPLEMTPGLAAAAADLSADCSPVRSRGSSSSARRELASQLADTDTEADERWVRVDSKTEAVTVQELEKDVALLRDTCVQWETSYDLLNQKYKSLKVSLLVDAPAQLGEGPSMLQDVLALLGNVKQMENHPPQPGVEVPVQDPATRLAPWIADQEVEGCMLCAKAFSFLRRRHHCRECGMVFCGQCSSNKSRVRGYKTLVRVCNGCYPMLQRQAHGQLRHHSVKAIAAPPQSPDPRQVRRKIVSRSSSFIVGSPLAHAQAAAEVKERGLASPMQDKQRTVPGLDISPQTVDRLVVYLTQLQQRIATVSESEKAGTW